MQIDGFFSLIANFYKSVLDLFNQTVFNFVGYDVSLAGVIVAAIVISMVLNFWVRSAKG